MLGQIGRKKVPRQNMVYLEMITSHTRRIQHGVLSIEMAVAYLEEN